LPLPTATRTHPYPSTGKPRGACPVYVVDHIVPPRAGGPDRPQIQRGKANPTLDAVENLAGGLKVPVVKLFED